MGRGKRESGQTLCLYKLMVILATSATCKGLVCIKGMKKKQLCLMP